MYSYTLPIVKSFLASAQDPFPLAWRFSGRGQFAVIRMLVRLLLRHWRRRSGAGGAARGQSPRVALFERTEDRGLTLVMRGHVNVEAGPLGKPGITVPTFIGFLTWGNDNE